MPLNPKLRVFLDSNVIFSGLHSSEGPSGVILEHFINGKLTVVISQQVLEEVVRTIKEKVPDALLALKRLLTSVPVEIVKNPTPAEIAHWAEKIHPEDAAILAAAIAAQPDYFITGDKGFLKNHYIEQRSGLHILTPAQFLGYLKA